MNRALYQLSKNQSKFLIGLAVVFLLLSIFWWVLEFLDIKKFPMEPIVVLVGGFATLFAVYWPFRPSYASQRMKGRHTVDFTSNDGEFVIGRNDMQFTLKWTNSSNESIHFYSDPSNIDAIAIASDCSSFKEIRNVSNFDFSSLSRKAYEGDIVALLNTSANYALVQVHDVRAQSHGDNENEITFSYIINPNKGTDFS